MLLKFLTNPYVRGLTILSAILSISILIYGWLNPNKIEFRLELESKEELINPKLIDEKLLVSYDSLELNVRNQNINKFRFKLKNWGTKELDETYYDSISIHLTNNQFIKLPTLDSINSDYFKKKIRLNIIGDSIIRIPSAIFNSKDGFTFSFKSVEYQNKPIEFSIIGNIKEQGNLNLSRKSEEQNSIQSLFNEKLSTHLIRLSFYSFVLVSLLGFLNLIILSGGKIIKIASKVERRSHVKRFKDLENYSYTRIDEVVFNRYILEGKDKLSLFNSKLSEVGKLKYHITKYSLTEEFVNKKHSKKEMALMSKEKQKYLNLVKEMKEDGFIYFENDELKKNLRLITFKQEFLSQLKNFKNRFNTKTN